MTPSPPGSDLSSDDGLRHGLRQLAEWADPVPVPDPDELAARVTLKEGPSGGRRLLAGAAALLLVGTVAVVLANHNDGPDRRPAASGDPALLVGRDWQIDSVTIDGQTLVPPADRTAEIRFGDGGVSGGACNEFGTDADVSPGSVSFGNEVSSTVVGCGGVLEQIDAAMLDLMHGHASWSVDGNQLRLEGSGVLLKAHQKPDAFPTPGLDRLAASVPGEFPQWQYGFTEYPEPESPYRYFLTVEARDKPGTAFGSSGAAVDSSVPMDVIWIQIGGDLLPFGTLPEGTAYAEFIPDDGSLPASSLVVRTLPDGRPVFGQIVEGTHGVVRAYGSDDELLAESRRLGD